VVEVLSLLRPAAVMWGYTTLSNQAPAPSHHQPASRPPKNILVIYDREPQVP